MCQIFLGLQAAQRGYRDALHRPDSSGRAVSSLDPAESRRLSDLESMRWSLAFAEQVEVPRAQWPPALSQDPQRVDPLLGPLRTMTLKELRQLAERLAEEMELQFARLQVEDIEGLKGHSQ
jgi:hypothetical protein